MAIELKPEIRKQALASIRKYCREQLDLDADDIQAISLLEFFLKEIAPTVYNDAIAEAQTFVQDRLADLEGSCYEPEFGYWPKSRSVQRKRD